MQKTWKFSGYFQFAALTKEPIHSRVRRSTWLSHRSAATRSAASWLRQQSSLTRLSITYRLGAMAKEKIDQAMAKTIRLFDGSGKTLEQLGLEMGYAEEVARKAAWQFLKKTSDP